MTETIDSERRDSAVAPAEHLRRSMAAVRLSFTWLGVRKTLSPQQRDQAADSFGAEGKFLSAGKKLLDTSHPAFKAVTAVKGRAAAFWKGISLPYPEPGLRLLRQSDIGPFDQRMEQFRAELAEAVAKLDEHYDELRAAARERLGDLYCAADYPTTLVGLFAIEHEFPAVDPPDYLRRLQPELYRQEADRVRARFQEAVRLAEQAFTEELAKLVDHLSERLQGDVDGKPKVFRDSAVTNLTEFFARFQSLSVGSDEQLEELVARARDVMQGIAPQQLREDQSTRQQVARQISAVQASLDQLMVDRPRRNLIRRPR
ncbi:hypothetical protein [Blastopirellula marina]|uniref:DUF3150 domain-containing protein n=1 Tax=Blastopirellula marina TaxID=124 RepID=A0A2S8GH93_9BACT|nr:hypothetical protein C5Y93_21830 [Blastopirellula marina]